MKTGIKLAAMLGLIVLMIFALAFVRNLVSDRQQRADAVRADIAQFGAGEQTLSGPVLVLPYTRTMSKLVEATKDRDSYWEDTQVVDHIVLTPAQFDANGKLAVEVLKRGLFEAPINTRFGTGVHAPVTLPDSTKDQQVDFNLTLNLTGSTQLLIAPVGNSNQIGLSGNWPHPSFAGNFVPLHRTITPTGFSARWQTSELATGGYCNGKENCSLTYVGLRLIDPVDRYVLNERTMKYAELFILLIFGAVFLMGIVHELTVYPVQYGLVGIGLALFFLLVLSLSEHIGFHKAYWLAAVASAGLQGFYVSYVLGGWRRGLGFAAILVALFGLLFGILQSEDMALLMGSLTLFGLLACVMYFTRNRHWGSWKSKD